MLGLRSEAPYWTSPRVRRMARRGEMVRSRRPANEDLNQKIKIETVILNGPLLRVSETK